MAMAYQKIGVVALTILIAVGSVSSVVAGALSCLPQACCCTLKTPDMPDMMNHQGQMETEKPQNCTPETPAPCCRVEPFQPKTDMAISSQPSIVSQRMTLVLMIADDAVKTPEQHDLNALKSVPDKGPLLKIPSIPIYLQTLSILC